MIQPAVALQQQNSTNILLQVAFSYAILYTTSDHRVKIQYWRTNTMLDNKAFAIKLKNHRKNLGLTQEEVATRIGLSPQAVSKWENGDCLPDCFNLKALADTYGISLDILLETEHTNEIDIVSAKIEQIADEFIWAKIDRKYPAHWDLGEDLWKMWKGIYFIEVGKKEYQQKDKEQGNLRICSEYGMKIWDDDGIACVIQASLREHLDRVNEDTLAILARMASPEGFRLLSALHQTFPTPKSELMERCKIDTPTLNELLLLFLEHEIIEFVSSKENRGTDGYKINAYYGMAAQLLLGAAFVLSKPVCTVSEYVTPRG